MYVLRKNLFWTKKSRRCTYSHLRLVIDGNSSIFCELFFSLIAKKGFFLPNEKDKDWRYVLYNHYFHGRNSLKVCFWIKTDFLIKTPWNAVSLLHGNENKAERVPKETINEWIHLLYRLLLYWRPNGNYISTIFCKKKKKTAYFFFLFLSPSSFPECD